VEIVMSIAHRRFAVGIGALMLFSAVAGNAQAADYYLKIPGVDGESADRNHPRWIELMSVAWETGMARGIAGCTPGRECRGSVASEKVAFTKAVDRTTPDFATAMQATHSFPSAILHFVKNGAVVGIYTFQGLAVAAYRQVPQGGHPTEQITMTYQKVEWSHATLGGSLSPR
jgi:type VI secretion system secreted protein Hcp